MKIFRWETLQHEDTQTALEKLVRNRRGTALTIGGFDGPHRGHQVLFDAVLDHAASHDLTPGVVTFTRSPGALKNAEHYPGDVSTLNLRLSALDRAGFDFVVLIDFSDDFGKMSGGVFFDILVKTVRMRYVAVGPDFRCGHRLDTGTADIDARSRRDGFRFDSIRQVEQDGIRISSSAVRKAVLSADFALAERLLGHPFLLDFNTPDWTPSGSGLVAERNMFTQILPPPGMYPAKLRVLENREQKVRVESTGGTVRLVPCENESLPGGEAIEAIQF
ncbi:MAG: Riboflavin biosynthesis protein RibF [Spirochaetes bacterium ADurb.Bin215]|nr:MAG: Riboflavin biosynthesis protein RibF [Spirochaetes bacterium ADurb.Bin215]